MNQIGETGTDEHGERRGLLRRHPVWSGLVVLCSFSVGLSQVTGFSLRDLGQLLWPARLSDETRSALRARVRVLAADGALTADDSQVLRDHLAGLGREEPAAERYLSEIKPPMLQAARSLVTGAELAVQGRFPEARARFREAARLDDENATAWANLGGAALELEELAEAEAALRKALELEPGNIEAHYNFGACLASQDRGPAALGHLERALTLLSRGDAPPAFDRQALLEDLEKSEHFSALRGSPQFAALIRRAQDDFR